MTEEYNGVSYSFTNLARKVSIGDANDGVNSVQETISGLHLLKPGWSQVAFNATVFSNFPEMLKDVGVA